MPTLLPTPTFRELTLALGGLLLVQHGAGQAIVTEPGEWIRYSAPGPGGAEYVAVCVPAFSPETVYRDPD